MFDSASRSSNGNIKSMFIIDLAVLHFSFLAYYSNARAGQSLPNEAFMLMGLGAIVWFVITVNSNILKINGRVNFFHLAKEVFIGFSVLSAVIISTVAIFGEFQPNNKLILYPLLIAFGICMVYRATWLALVKHFIGNGYKQRSLLVIGGDRVAERVINTVISKPELGFRIHGVIADYYHETMPKGIYLGNLERAREVIRTGLIDEVVIALPLRREKEIFAMVERCEREGVRYWIVPDYFRVARNRVQIEQLGDIPMLAMRTEPLSTLSNRIVKRTFDIVFSLAVLVALAPLFLLIAVLIKRMSPGPVFFKQYRIGANNKDFEMIKFRTMCVQETNESDTIWTTCDDDRVTGIGAFLRRTSIDELPQFWNVLVGDMSVVGPRPEREYFVEQFRKDIPYYKVRHLVKSGITGWAQVNGWRGDTSIAKRVECDIFYLENWSFWFDLKIILMTVFSSSGRKHAY